MLTLKALVAAGIVLAHSWYDPYCCNGKDCGPIEYKDVQPLSDGGFLYKGYVFPPDTVHPSQDGQYHACIYRGQPRCFYVPPAT